MRIGAGVAVAGEVLRGRQHAVVLQPANLGRDEAGHQRRGSSPNDRVLMIGLAGLLFTSATGAKARWMPTARPSSAVMRPIS